MVDHRVVEAVDEVDLEGTLIELHGFLGLAFN